MKRNPLAARPAANRLAKLTATFAFIGLVLILFATVRFDIKGHFDGLFLLQGTNGWHYELKDDLYVGDGDRIIASLDFDDPRYRFFRKVHPKRPSSPYLYYEWDATDGSGFFRNILPNGMQMLTCFGRYMDDDKRYVHGLFVGGGLPSSIAGGDNTFMDNTGMAFYDGTRWYHVWCNVNEAIVALPSNRIISPSGWKFLGSKVIDESSSSVVVSSSHQVDLDGVPLRIDRYVYLNAGDSYFVITIKLTDIGTVPARYTYIYGDEPWVGNYGSSAGNVGWVQDRMINYEEVIDSTKYSYAGIYDYGNDAIHEGHTFTGTANFIQWFGSDRPTVFFSNSASLLSPSLGKRKVPLASNARFIGVQWTDRTLAPGKSTSYTLAIGMALHDPARLLPVKPAIKLDAFR